MITRGGHLAVILPALAAILAGQYPPDPGARGSIEGSVRHYSSGNPMPRVLVVLHPAGSEIAARAMTTDRHGNFAFTELPSGYYAVSARHPGFLPAVFAQTEYTRLPVVFGLMPGERLDGIVIRMRPGGVISGRVEFTDGIPAVGVPVELYREYFYRGRHGFRKSGQASTDDRGEYRIFGLPPGKYYIAAGYSPPSPGAGVEEQKRIGPDGLVVAEEDFVTTYYPSTARMIEAQPVRLRYSEELEHADILLARARAARLRGRLISGVTGRIVAGADIRLRQPSPAAEVLVDAPAAVRPAPDGGFEIAGVTPGSYTLVAHAIEEGTRLTGSVPVTVGGSDVDHLDVTLEPSRELDGKLVSDEKTDFPLSLFRISLEPHSDSTAVSSVKAGEDGSFRISYVPGETYDIFLLDGPPDAYLKSARIGGFDVLRTGFKAEGGALPPLELEFSTRGASVWGEVAETKTRVALGATVALVPEPARGKVQFYQHTTTDAYGKYQFRGVAPGRYTVIAWWDDPPCEVYDLEALEACREHGKPVEVREGETKMVNLAVAR